MPFGSAPQSFGDEYYDQHGRGWRYSATPVERDPNNAASLTQDRQGYGSPIDFVPPWRVPEEFIRTLPKVRGQNRIHLDYEGYIAERYDGYQAWHDQGTKLMKLAFKSQWTPGMEFTDDILREMGDEPQPWQIADAALRSKPGSAVHQWLLYGEGDCPPQLVRYFPQARAALADEIAGQVWDDEPTGENLNAAEKAEKKRSHHKQREPEAALEG